MKTDNILFVTHQKSQCGVYEFGENIFNAIKESKKFNFIKVECSNLKTLNKAVSKVKPTAIVYNYMPETMPWIASTICRNRILKNNIADIPVVQIGIIHSILQDIADSSRQAKKYIKNTSEKSNCLFDFYIAPDPTLILMNPFVFKHGRPVQMYTNHFPMPEEPTIGSFGFTKEGYGDLIELVQSNFDKANIRLSIPFAKFGDINGAMAIKNAEECKSKIQKPGIKLTISHEYLDKNKLLDFLAQNTINVFLRNNIGRGISSVIDYALSVSRPIAIADSRMFRHVRNSNPSICINDNPLVEIIKNGITPLNKYTKEWTDENLCWEYERILASTLKDKKIPTRTFNIKKIKSFLKSIFQLITGDASLGYTRNSWLSNTNCLCEDDYKSVLINSNYDPIDINLLSGFNRILDNHARLLYKPAEEHLFKLIPNTMAKKNKRANVQQAFVFDTVFRHLKKYTNPKILCVGSFEDTACMALIKMGIAVDEIDPTFDYTLQEFFTKPDQKKASYDIIFSTSVIEHCPDDQSFMECISELLSPQGMVIITCDYKEGWLPGDPKPGVCARLYTKVDLKNRLPSYLKKFKFIDTPNWDCSNPDFDAGTFKYTFATFVAIKE